MGRLRSRRRCSALDHLVQSGKVRYIGCSNYAAWQLMKALWIADRKGLTPFVSNQVYYSLQARDIENELVPLAVDQGLGILVWSPIAGGLLSGKYRRGVEAPPGSRHLTEWSEPPVYDEDKLYDTIEELVAIGEDLGVSAAQVALAYTMAKPAVTSVIVGARTEDQLADNLAAADLTLSASEMDRWTRSAHNRCPTRSGTTANAAATASVRPISRCWRVTLRADSLAAVWNEPFGRSRATSSPRLRTPTLANIDFR